MTTVGLTGGIGSGKSTVSRLLADRGALVIDADVLAREALAPATQGEAQVVEAFGSDVVGPDGTLDRGALARRVFTDPQELARLNAIVHPYVARRSRELMSAAPADAVLVYDVPLLVETGQQDRYDVVVIVEASVETRLARLRDSRNMTEEEARARMAAQASSAERRSAADFVIENDAGWTSLEEQVDRLWSLLTEMPPPAPE